MAIFVIALTQVLPGVVAESSAEVLDSSAATEPGASTELGACAALELGLVVEVDRRLLHLCRDGLSEAEFPVNLGKGGTGKTKQGDGKTPLGRYTLGRPRPSVSGFTWFVPIGYPTKAQSEAGYTGGAIGIHGPPDWMPQWVIDWAFGTPWTDGCVMVRTKQEIEAIRAWILQSKPTTIEIR